MTIDIKNNEGNLIVKPVGRLDSSTAGEFDEALSKSINDDVKLMTIDLSEVDFISSKGLRVLVSAYHSMNGREMILQGVNASIMEVLKLSGLLKVFTIKEE